MPDTSAAGREAQEIVDRVRAKRDDPTIYEQRQAAEDLRRRQIRIDKMATAIYAGMDQGDIQDPGEAVKSAVRQAVILAAAVDKALGITAAERPQ
jgi:hypothetical protein